LIPYIDWILSKTKELLNAEFDVLKIEVFPLSFKMVKGPIPEGLGGKSWSYLKFLFLSLKILRNGLQLVLNYRITFDLGCTEI
jgi:hypothetical protein